MNAVGPSYVLEARNARAMPLTIELRAGVTLDPLSIGRNGTWMLDAAGVLMQHAFLYFDGEELFVQSTDPHVPVVTANGPIPTQWTRVAAPCTLVFGAGSIVFAKVEAAAIAEDAPDSGGPDTVPGEPPSAVVALPSFHEPDSERTEVGPPPGRLAHLASTTPIFEMALLQQPTAPLSAMPTTERLPRGVGPRVAASPPPPPAPAPPPPPAAPVFEAKPPPWPPPAMLAAIATPHAAPPHGTTPMAMPRPASVPPPMDFKPIDPAGPDDATMHAPIPVDGPVPTVGTGPYAMPPFGAAPRGAPLYASAPPPVLPAAPPTPNPVAAWWRAAPLPRKLLAILLPVAVVLAVLSLLTDGDPPPAPKAKRAAPAASATPTR